MVGTLVKIFIRAIENVVYVGQVRCSCWEMIVILNSSTCCIGSLRLWNSRIVRENTWWLIHTPLFHQATRSVALRRTCYQFLAIWWVPFRNLDDRPLWSRSSSFPWTLSKMNTPTHPFSLSTRHAERNIYFGTAWYILDHETSCSLPYLRIHWH